ncbi:UNVERIFIED_CONTAM: hypothetical protein GTU68_001408 [Idotea baltica]|nr:hypothetical protein [Idotea baltica]
MRLYNTYDRKVLREQLQRSDAERTTLSFYKYAKIGNPNFFRDYLYLNWEELGVMGRIYVAHEGINAQISVPTINWSDFENKLNEVLFLEQVRLNVAREDDGKSFFKLKILVRPKIVADGLNDASFDASDGGQHLDAQSFNTITADDNTLLIDMRNHYESEVGHFKGAITPDVDTFRDSLPIIEEQLRGNEEKNIVMYCTGGIRCEKASAWFKHKGYENVFQLDGGIIEYSRQVNEQGIDNKFIGKNFVFDERLGERITEDVIAVCHQCGTACDDHTNCVNEACHVLFIQCKKCKSKFENCCSKECKTVIQLPIEEQRELRKGKKVVRNIFKKGRSQNLKYKK